MKDENEKIVVAQIMGKWLGGGVESIIMNYYEHIDRNKIQFDFICDEDSTNIPYKKIEELGGRVFLVSKYQNIFKYIKLLKKLFKKEKYQIVHSNINTLSVFPLYAAKKAGVPIRIAHSHSTIVKNKKEFKRNIIKNILKKFSCRYANVLFACSNYAAITQFGKKNWEQNKVTLINNAIDTKKFKFSKEKRSAYRKELGIGENTIVIGHIGRFVTTKNHDYIVEIFKKYHEKESNSVLLFGGQGPLEQEIKNKVLDYKLNDQVVFLGQREDIYKYYNVMDIFVLPSLYEGLPVVGIEAQTSGLPCLFSNNMSENAKVLETTKFLSIAEDAKYWADNIIVLKDSSKRIEACNIIKKNGYDIENEANKLEKIYFALLKEKGGK